MHTLPVADFATNSEPTYLSTFGEMVTQYSGRDLTVHRDRLFAFEGVLNTIKKVDPRKEHFWALTTWDFELELDWIDVFPYPPTTEFSPYGGDIFPSWSWLSYPHAIAFGSKYADIVCFRFFHDAVTACLECERISPMKYQPGTRVWDISMPMIYAQFPRATFNADRQIVFWAGVAKLGVDWDSKLTSIPGRYLTGYDEAKFPAVNESSRCLSAWSIHPDKTRIEYDFISINRRLRGDEGVRSVWMLHWKNGVAIRGGHGVIGRAVWASLVKEWRIIVME